MSKSKGSMSERKPRRVALRWLSAVLALGLLAGACGSDRDDTDAGNTTTTTTAAPDPGGDGDGDGTTTTTEAPPADPCADVTLEATEIGVSEDTIKVIVMADVDSPLAQGLFQGSVDGMEAWADRVNAEGGLACREVEVEFHDSKLTPATTVEGFLKACESALALVGTTVLFALDTNDLNTCEDQAGNPIGVPDIGYITTEVAHQCSANSFLLSRPGAECPYEGGPRDYTAAVGAMSALSDQLGTAFNGIFIVPGDLPSTIASAVPQVAAQEEIGVTFDGVYGVSGSATQTEFGRYVTTMRDNDSNYVYNGSNDQAMLKMKREAALQGIDTEAVTWLCTLSCYTPAFINEGGADAEGVYVWSFFLPFEEAETNDELGAFMENIGTDFPPAWAAGAWIDGLLFEEAINTIVDRDGPNGITRQAVLDELSTITTFNAGGWWSDTDFTTTNTIGSCFMIMQVQDGEYVRVHPEERGTLDCSTDAVAVTADPDAFALD
jgi:ABC-type branched-subunit amino acid transport system substrate-binding protein